MYDVEDIAYFFESLKDSGIQYCTLTRRENGTIQKINVIYPLRYYKNFNNELIDYFNEDLLRNIL